MPTQLGWLSHIWRLVTTCTVHSVTGFTNHFSAFNGRQCNKIITEVLLKCYVIKVLPALSRTHRQLALMLCVKRRQCRRFIVHQWRSSSSSSSSGGGAVAGVRSGVADHRWLRCRLDWLLMLRYQQHPWVAQSVTVTTRQASSPWQQTASPSCRHSVVCVRVSAAVRRRLSSVTGRISWRDAPVTWLHWGQTRYTTPLIGECCSLRCCSVETQIYMDVVI